MEWVIVAFLTASILPDLLPAIEWAVARPIACESRIHTPDRWKHFAPG
jgi:hypothetical protein